MKDLLNKYNKQTSLRIGLLGGSFNPAHKGHLHISEEALKLFNLDEVWWLVSPQNPLKSAEGMESFESRLKKASNAALNSKIFVTDVEKTLGTQYTVDTLNALTDIFPNMKFIWLMGADNLKQMPLWKNWQEIFSIVPIAVFDRKDYSDQENTGEIAKILSSSKVAEKDVAMILEKELPAWVFVHSNLCNISSTFIRENK
jgi:nicotinate-nucleotide adenylyltransferase